jgi:hypothetical protein
MSSASGVLPAVTDPRWTALVTYGTTLPLKRLVLQIVLKRMNREVRLDPRPANVKKQIDELSQFVVKHARMLAPDTAMLFG